jgi:hypothetical protein
VFFSKRKKVSPVFSLDRKACGLGVFSFEHHLSMKFLQKKKAG